MAATLLVCVLARAVLGKTVHPVEDAASKTRTGEGAAEEEGGAERREGERDEEEAEEGERLDSFFALTISGHVLAQLAVLLSICDLPVALTGVEAAHCLAIVAIVQFEMLLTKALSKLLACTQPSGSPFDVIARAEWRPFLLWPNVAAWCRSHSLASFAYYAWGILWYESYVNMLLAGPLARCGWPLVASASAVGLSTGVLNHGAVNGLQNGVMAGVFYVTMAVMFSVSGSVLSVTVAHSLFYFRQLHAGATSVAFGQPLFVAVLVANTACIFMLLRALSGVLPPAVPLEAAQRPSGLWSCGGAFAAASLAADCVRLCVFTRRYMREAKARRAPDDCFVRLERD